VLRAANGDSAMTIHPAETGDLPAVRQLLEASHLPLDGVDAQLSTMVVATDGSGVVGAAAVELYADGALLRSVVVSPTVQGQGVGHRLTEAALNIAKRRGVRHAFLLTTTAERFFPRLGFEQISRDEVPESVQASVEFQSACPASATVMRKQLA
jgi:amino-acid N-acetyltransferase